LLDSWSVTAGFGEVDEMPATREREGSEGSEGCEGSKEGMRVILV
jgi:hypothetical protein